MRLIAERYELAEKELGRGTAGVVYAATDLHTKEEVAVKLLRTTPEITADELHFLKETLRRERDASGRLDHVNIVRSYEYGTDGDQVYLVMELVTGGRSLNQLGALTPHQIIQILRQVADALDHAWSKRVIHRDVKPDNILIDDFNTAKLTDFNVARIVGDKTIFKPHPGTLRYMSPEQCMAKELTGASDQYALACMAYELLVAKVPFPGSEQESAIARCTSPPPPPSRMNKRLSQLADEVLLKALDYEPMNRFESCLSFIDSLEMAVNPPWPYRIRATSKSPGLIIYLLDVSGSMKDLLHDGVSKIDHVRSVMSEMLKRMQEQARSAAGTVPRYEIAILTYSNRVTDILGGTKHISEILCDSVLAKIQATELKTHTDLAFESALALLKQRLMRYGRRPAPLVCHLTDGMYNGESEPGPIADEIARLRCLDGNVLVQNIYIANDLLKKPIDSITQWEGIFEETDLNTNYAKELFRMSSPLPDSYANALSDEYKLREGARMLFPVSTRDGLILAFVASKTTPKVKAPQT